MAKKKIATKAAAAIAWSTRFFSALEPARTTAWSTTASTADLSPKNRAATLPTQQPFIAHISLGALVDAEVDMHMTVVLPPATAMQPNPEVRKRLAALDLSRTED